MKYYGAIDLGASSGRLVLSSLKGSRICLKEVHRFDNTLIMKNGHQCWNIEHIFHNIIIALKKCKDIECVPSSIGIDTWGVDFVLLDCNDNLIGDCVAYRDERTKGMYDMADKLIPRVQHYSKTGIQRQPFNTIYQLLALKHQNPEQLDKAESFLMIPDYLNYLLCGIKINEYTNASSTGLINAKSCNWDKEILQACGIPSKIFSKPTMPGIQLGCFTKNIQEQVGFNCKVVLPATHDTGSAFLAVPAKNDNSVFLSSGTWSLLGVENKNPITDTRSMELNFTNEGGFEKRYRYLRNIMGLWLIQSVRRELNGVKYIEDSGDGAQQYDKDLQDFLNKYKKPNGKKYEFSELADYAKQEKDFDSIVDVNDERFLSPNSMIAEIMNACRDAEINVPKNLGQLMQCIYKSLAICYRNAIEQLQIITGKQYEALNIVGGGCQDKYLNQIAADVCGITVYAGPIEATCIGNVAVQLIIDGKINNISEAWSIIMDSFNVQEYKPN